MLITREKERTITAVRPHHRGVTVLEDNRTEKSTEEFLTYKYALQLHSLYNTQNPTMDWVNLNFYQNYNNREPNFRVCDLMNYKVGKKLTFRKTYSLKLADPS